VADAAGGAVHSVWPVTSTRRRAIAALSLCGVAIVAIVVLTFVLSQNVVYFRTVSEAVASKKSDADHRFRMAGKVVPGTVKETARGVNFEITDGKATVAVIHQGDPPSLFKAGAPVVCEGHWSTGAAFDSDRIMIRHGSEYKPPKVDVKNTDASSPSNAAGGAAA
jgi:cytochrome c-type biogenesis protein CcmE